MELGPWLDGEPGRKGVIEVEEWAEIRRPVIGRFLPSPTLGMTA
jgi:hypothetical protein